MKESTISAKHNAASQACGDLQECFVAMGKEVGAGVEGTMYRKVASHFGKLKQAHGDLADLHAQGEDDSEKVHRDELGKLVEREVESVLSKTLRPDKFSSVAPNDAPGFGITAGIRSVVRPGQPAMDLGKAIENVPAGFRHLVENLNLDHEV